MDTQNVNKVSKLQYNFDKNVCIKFRLFDGNNLVGYVIEFTENHATYGVLSSHLDTLLSKYSLTIPSKSDIPRLKVSQRESSFYYLEDGRLVSTPQMSNQSIDILSWVLINLTTNNYNDNGNDAFGERLSSFNFKWGTSFKRDEIRQVFLTVGNDKINTDKQWFIKTSEEYLCPNLVPVSEISSTVLRHNTMELQKTLGDKFIRDTSTVFILINKSSLTRDDIANLSSDKLTLEVDSFKLDFENGRIIKRLKELRTGFTVVEYVDLDGNYVNKASSPLSDFDGEYDLIPVYFTNYVNYKKESNFYCKAFEIRRKELELRNASQKSNKKQITPTEFGVVDKVDKVDTKKSSLFGSVFKAIKDFN